MVSRRSFLLALGTLPASGVVIGSRAFAQVSADEVIVSQFSETRDLSSIDPMRSLDFTIPGSLIFDPLLDRNAEGHLIPALATAWERVAPDTWRFTIRGDAHFHDGSPLTAADCAATLNYIVNPANRSGIRLQVAPLASAEAPDATTLLLKTSVPTGLLPDIISGAITLPAKQVADPAAPFRTAPIGSGPWKIDEMRAGERISFVAAETHWRAPRPAYRKVIVKVVPEASTRVADLLSGGAQVAADIPPALTARIARARGVKLVIQPGVRTQYLSFNFKPPFDNAKVRQAVYHAIDRKALAETIWAELAEAATGAVPEGYGGYVPAFPFADHDPARARALLREAGLSAPVAVDLVVPPIEAQAAQVLQAQLAAAGFEVSIRPVESVGAVLDPKRIAAETRGQLWMITALDNHIHDAIRPYNAFYAQGGFLKSGLGYQPPAEMEALLRSYASAEGEAPRKAATEALMALAKADMAVIYLAYPHMAYGVADAVDMPRTSHGRFDFMTLRPR